MARRMSKLPQTFPRFSFGLQEFGHADVSVDRCGTTLDDLHRPDTSVWTFTGVLRVCVGDALSYCPSFGFRGTGAIVNRLDLGGVAYIRLKLIAGM